MFRLSAAVLFATFLIARQEYSGPPPPRRDAIYLVHADDLVETETATARAQTVGNDLTYVIPGERSMARTPLASPTLVIEAAGINAEKLQLFRLDVKNGHREIRFRYKAKSGAIPLRAEISRLPERLYQIDVIDSLAAGEYALSPDGTNDVFCFEVF